MCQKARVSSFFSMSQRQPANQTSPQRDSWSYVYILTDEDCEAIYGHTSVSYDQRHLSRQELRNFVENNQATEAMIAAYNRPQTGWGSSPDALHLNRNYNAHWGDPLPNNHGSRCVNTRPFQPQRPRRPTGWGNNVVNNRQQTGWGTQTRTAQPHTFTLYHCRFANPPLRHEDDQQPENQ